MKTKFMSIMAVVLMVVGISVGSATTASAATPTQAHTDNIEQIAELFDRHNAARIENGVDPLVYSPELAIKYAQPYSQKLASTEGPLKHQEMGPMLREVQGAMMVGENLYVGSGQYATPEQAVYHLMRSPTHKENMLDRDYDMISIGWYVSEKGAAFATIHFWTGNINVKTYSSGAKLIDGVRNPSKEIATKALDVYVTEGYHEHNGRRWWTKCEPYSQIERCRTEIWASQIVLENGIYVNKQGWVFNNLTYTASSRSLWQVNPLGGNGVRGGKVSWKAQDGRQWRTECDTALTGQNGCRSFIMATVIEKQGNSYVVRTKEIFNNMVRFTN